MTFGIIDRRLNPSGKSLTNRQRFVERVRGSIRKSARKVLNSRNIEDKSDADVGVSKDGIEEPQFHYAKGKGVWDHVMPGNHDYVVGDNIPRPPPEGGRGSEGSVDGESDDDFRFSISYQEYVDAILEDLCLPDMIKQSDKQTVSFTRHRAGFTTVGSTSNLALERTMIHGLGRRIALKFPKLERIEELIGELQETDDEQRQVEINEEIAALRQSADAVSFLEKSDLRYVNFEKRPTPITQAVMIAIMDVSGSMTEHMKELSKRFYLLLWLFLTRQYKQVEIVFIRHTHVAAEVDQDTFFHATDTGGTVVSAAYDEAYKIIKTRYDVNNWNLYMAQCSDGDNSSSDNASARDKLTVMLPWFQYVTYVEVSRDSEHFPPGFIRRDSDVWKMFEEISAITPKTAARRLSSPDNVIEVFRSLFQKQSVKA